MVAAALDESGSRCVTAADDRQELHVLERDGDAWRSCCAPWRVRFLLLRALPRVSPHTPAWGLTSSHALRGAQAHDAPLRGVAWASAVFGSMLASCGDDGVRVWAVLPGEQAKLLATLGVAEHAAAVVCVAFGPQHLGLRLAAGGADGVVRLYAAQDRTSGWEEEVSITSCAAPGTAAENAHCRAHLRLVRPAPVWPGACTAPGVQRRWQWVSPVPQRAFGRSTRSCGGGAALASCPEERQQA